MDNEPWEESLDLDDCDLPSLRRQNLRTTTTTAETETVVFPSQPFLRPCSLLSLSSQNRQSLSPPNPPPRLIPGPAGVVQAAMHRRKHELEDPIPTQEYIRRAVEDGAGAEDDDFSCDPWLASVEFIRRQGLVLGDEGAIGVPLSAIKSGVVNLDDKVTQIVAIVKSCNPNGVGDLMVTLKDPTASIDASVHRGVVSNNEFGKDISVGAVMILKNVAVFSPSRYVHYLNITVRNVVKVISKGGGGLLRQSGCSATLNSKEVCDRGNETITKSSECDANGRELECVGGGARGDLLTQSGCSSTLKSKESDDRTNEVIMKNLVYDSNGGGNGGLLTQSGGSSTLKRKGSGDKSNEVIMKILGYDSNGGGSADLLTQIGCSSTLKSKGSGDRGNEVIMKSLGYDSNGRKIEYVGGDSGSDSGGLLTHSSCSATQKRKDRGTEVSTESLGYDSNVREIGIVGGDSGGLLTQSGFSYTLKSKDGGDRGAEVIKKGSVAVEKERAKDGDLVDDDVPRCKEIGNGVGAKEGVQRSSKASILQWTDEQLEELFASD